jgi:hypothetical protein
MDDLLTLDMKGVNPFAPPVMDLKVAKEKWDLSDQLIAFRCGKRCWKRRFCNVVISVKISTVDSPKTVRYSNKL